MTTSSASTRGLYDKYEIRRNEGGDVEPGDKHYKCRYFVLDLTHDPLAKAAIIAYLLQLPLSSPLRQDLTEALASMKEGT